MFCSHTHTHRRTHRHTDTDTHRNTQTYRHRRTQTHTQCSCCNHVMCCALVCGGFFFLFPCVAGDKDGDGAAITGGPGQEAQGEPGPASPTRNKYGGANAGHKKAPLGAGEGGLRNRHIRRHTHEHRRTYKHTNTNTQTHKHTDIHAQPIGICCLLLSCVWWHRFHERGAADVACQRVVSLHPLAVQWTLPIRLSPHYTKAPYADCCCCCCCCCCCGVVG